MPGISRTGDDTCGGILSTSLQSTVFVGGSLVAVIGTPVQSHGDSPHNSAVMSGGSSTVFAGGIAVCRTGDPCSCGHTVTGSSTVFAG
jgi:uncharacterized Zn-binding protein involved in type VI secretion